MDYFVTAVAFEKLEHFREPWRQGVIEKKSHAAARKLDSYSIAALTDRSSTLYQLATLTMAAFSKVRFGSGVL